MKIRKATKKDFKECLKIDNQKYLKKKDFENSIKNKDVIFLVVEEDKKIIGYIFGYIDPCKREDALIYETRVSKKNRKKGIGTKLVDNFCKECSKKKVKSISALINKKHLKFYSGSCKFKKGISWIEVSKKK